MTGYGKASVMLSDKKITVEVKSLNGKFLDVGLKMPGAFRAKEIDIRKTIAHKIGRGKLDVQVHSEPITETETSFINQPLFDGYYKELLHLKEKNNATDDDLISSILRIPNVVNTDREVCTDEDWNGLVTTLTKALDHLNGYREKEGKTIEDDFKEKIHTILKNLDDVEGLDASRNERVKDKIHQTIGAGMTGFEIDENRLEQELIHYLDKMDINEEKVRLKTNCQFFLETLETKIKEKGKKLNFISQEIGREINTMGAKAYDADIQRLVIVMKDNLEKVKEQIANVL